MGERVVQRIQPMKRWGRRSLYLVGFVTWLAAMTFPIIAFLLATQNEIDIGVGQRYHLRLFLLQEPDFQGVSIEWTRPTAGSASCSKSTVSYFLWEGKGENTSYCLCFDPAGGGVSTAVPSACEAP